MPLNFILKKFARTRGKHAIFKEKSMENKSNEIINYEASKRQVQVGVKRFMESTLNCFPHICLSAYQRATRHFNRQFYEGFVGI